MPPALNRSALALAALAAFGAGAAASVAFRLLRRQSKMRRGKRAAVVLSGCGYVRGCPAAAALTRVLRGRALQLDGSEVTESVAMLVALSEFGVAVTVFAPDANQTDVVDHNSGKALGYVPRHMMQESARISRGNVRALKDLDASEFDALLCPGGFGAAKSLSTWAKGDAQAAAVLPDLKRAMLQFREQGKPIGLCCIAPTLASRCFEAITVTVGRAGPGEDWPYAGTVAQLEALPGVKHVEMDVGEVCVDAGNKLVTTPAYMKAAAPHEVFYGVRGLVKQVCGLI
jgi:enhancing lycopene biosynthesis protein 2